ncbi:MAG: AMIN-like domain-containing (lipo)protein [Candidatus Limnocylindria bacterium]
MARRLLPFHALAVTAVVLAAACAPQVVPPQSSAPATALPTATVAQPSPTMAATPTPTPSPSPTAGPSASPGSTPVACPDQSGGSDAAQAQITAIRTAHHPGFDRVVFELGPSSIGAYGLPPWSIAVTNGFVGTSGRQVPVDGNAFLLVRFRNASTVDPSTGTQTFTRTDIHPGLPLVRDVKLVDDFERVMTWGLGLEHLACPKVTELAGPARLVVDLPTPP